MGYAWKLVVQQICMMSEVHILLRTRWERCVASICCLNSDKVRKWEKQELAQVMYLCSSLHRYYQTYFIIYTTLLSYRFSVNLVLG